MDLIHEPRRAEIVILYLVNVCRALLIDKRRVGDQGPWIEVLPQEDLLLGGRAVEAPLTAEAVRSIESLQIVPSNQRVVQSYYGQLLHHLAARLDTLRPGLPAARLACVGPHFGPVMVLGVSELWREVMRELEARGEHKAITTAREKLLELYATEVLYRDRADPDQAALLRQDFAAERIYRTYTV